MLLEFPFVSLALVRGTRHILNKKGSKAKESHTESSSSQSAQLTLKWCGRLSRRPEASMSACAPRKKVSEGAAFAHNCQLRNTPLKRNQIFPQTFFDRKNTWLIFQAFLSTHAGERPSQALTEGGLHGRDCQRFSWHAKAFTTTYFSLLQKALEGQGIRPYLFWPFDHMAFANVSKFPRFFWKKYKTFFESHSNSNSTFS